MAKDGCVLVSFWPLLTETHCLISWFPDREAIYSTCCLSAGWGPFSVAAAYHIRDTLATVCRLNRPPPPSTVLPSRLPPVMVLSLQSKQSLALPLPLLHDPPPVVSCRLNNSHPYPSSGISSAMKGRTIKHSGKSTKPREIGWHLLNGQLPVSYHTIHWAIPDSLPDCVNRNRYIIGEIKYDRCQKLYRPVSEQIMPASRKVQYWLGRSSRYQLWKIGICDSPLAFNVNI